jgi:hypothetical protein
MSKIETKPDKAKDEQKPAKSEADDSLPAAGPHAAPHLTNPDATPGAGVMPDYGPASSKHGDVDGGSG